MKKALLSILFLIFTFTIVSCGGGKPSLVFVCDPGNELFRAVSNSIPDVRRFDTVNEALQQTPEHAGLLILASGYPETAVKVSDDLFETAQEKNIRLYVEYPSAIPANGAGEYREANLERGVVSSGFFGDSLSPMDIIYMHDCRFYAYKAESPHLVLARVAGFDRAVYGLGGTESFPMLFEASGGNVLIAATALSNCIGGRYAPTDSWKTVWNAVLGWLGPEEKLPTVEWQESVRPRFAKDVPLADSAARNAIQDGADWYYTARLLIHADWRETYDKTARDWPDRVGPMPDLSWKTGDGSFGVLEGFCSRVDYSGTQKMRWWRRNDCNAEVAGSLALSGKLLDDSAYSASAANIAGWLIHDSIMTQGNRADPAHPAYGLFGWNDVHLYYGDMDGYGVYYGDDNARSLLGLMAVSALAAVEGLDESIMRCILANFRTAGPLGFRYGRINEADLVKNGLEFYRGNDAVSYAPHFQSYLWACYLWAYSHTGFEPFLERAKTAIRMTMEAYPDKWVWTNGIQQERARMLLPLAWLVRVEDTPEHRRWLKSMADEMLSDQVTCGAIREEIGDNPGRYGPPKTNAEYGTNEASLIHENGDPLSDLLYTTNFAFLGLHEAAASTGDSYYHDAENRLADFLIRIQAVSETHPELNGAWFRAFDYSRWEHWASNADAGWGAWSTESGWTQGWIVSVLAMRELDISLWDLTRDSGAGEHFDDLKKRMLLR